MRKTLQRWSLLAILLTGPPAWAVTSNLQLVGLAVHQETGREIYLGAIHIDRAVPPPTDLMQFTGHKAMEYRVVARRTSIRSLLGSILLQAELASGHPADASTAAFVDAILSRVQGSLYAGDALDFALSAGNDTVASLNGHELARATGGGVFDYLLLGWLGEKGASAEFRSTLLAPDIDASLLAAYRAHEAPPERVADIGAWLAPEPGPAAIATASAPANEPPASATTIPVAPAGTAMPLPAPAPGPDAVPAVATVAALSGSEPVAPAVTATGGHADPPAVIAAAPQTTVQLATITPQGQLLTPDPTLSQALSLANYSQRLAEFNAMVMRKVYGSIRYPKSAGRRNIQGSLELDLHLNADGSLREAVVARGSGHNTLDAAAIRAAETAFGSRNLESIDEVAVGEYGTGDGRLIVPVPVSFQLME